MLRGKKFGRVGGKESESTEALSKRCWRAQDCHKVPQIRANATGNCGFCMSWAWRRKDLVIWDRGVKYRP